MIAPLGTRADKETELSAWIESIGGSELLKDLEGADQAGLRVAVETWCASTLGKEDASITVVEAPTVVDSVTTVRLHIEREGSKTWAEATLAQGSIWQVTEKPEGFGLKEERVPMVDVSVLGTLMPEGVATEVSRQLAASGIEGAAEAWTTAESVTSEGEVTRLTIWFPTQGEGAQAWDASYDESFDMLEVTPQEGVA